MDVPDDPLAQAIAAYLGGSTDRFRDIISLTHRDLRLFVSVRLPSAELYEEALQRVYIAAFEQFKKGVTPNRPLAWLRGIARNVSADIQRERYAGERPLDPFEAMLVDDAAERLDRAGNPDAAPQLDQCMEELAPRARRILKEAYINEVPHKRLAQMFKMKATAITKLLFRTRKALRDCLDKQGAW